MFTGLQTQTIYVCIFISTFLYRGRQTCSAHVFLTSIRFGIQRMPMLGASFLFLVKATLDQSTMTD